MSDEPRKHPDASAAAIPADRYEPPRVEKLGSLRDLLATKTGPGLDPSPHYPWSKR